MSEKFFGHNSIGSLVLCIETVHQVEKRHGVFVEKVVNTHLHVSILTLDSVLDNPTDTIQSYVTQY